MMSIILIQLLLWPFFTSTCGCTIKICSLVIHILMSEIVISLHDMKQILGNVWHSREINKVKKRKSS
jgi:hypothetical protein